MKSIKSQLVARLHHSNALSNVPVQAVQCDDFIYIHIHTQTIVQISYGENKDLSTFVFWA